MIVPFALALALQDSSPTSGEIVSKMIARYHDAKTVKGTCSTKLKVGVQEILISTTVQVERPLKLYVLQTVADSRFMVVSDGKEFAYSKPVSTPDSDRNPTGLLKEPVTPETSLGEIYRAAAQSLAERSAVLDLVIGDMRDLQRLREQWKTLDLTGEVDLNGEKVYRIVGRWRVAAGAPDSATFGLYITKDGDLKRYVLEQLPGVGAEAGSNEPDVKATREYTVDLKVGGDVDTKLFTVPK